MKISQTLVSLFAPVLVFLCPQGAQSHSVQVRHCITTSNTLRIFVEHWHTTSGPTTGQMRLTVNGGPDQIINGNGTIQGESDPDKLIGCKTECSTTDSGCQLGGINQAGAHEDWVYFDFPVTDVVTLKGGTNFYLENGCIGNTTAVYPVTVSAANDDCGCPCDELGHQCCITGTEDQYEVCVNAADLSLTAITKDTATGTKCCVHPADPLRIIQQHSAMNCPQMNS